MLWLFYSCEDQYQGAQVQSQDPPKKKFKEKVWAQPIVSLKAELLNGDNIATQSNFGANTYADS